MPDATEYTIASIDASGGKDGFADGEAFRPTINNYMYSNANAIANIAAMKGDTTTWNTYIKKAMDLKNRVQQSLWNDSLQHFTDRFKVSNEYVHYWNFIRGLELAGMIPWYYNLPADSPKYNAAWKHVTGETELPGKYGLRTNEPSYEYYFRQFVFSFGKPGSQWNGPGWPYQTSQVTPGMANVTVEYSKGDAWLPVNVKEIKPATFIGNTANTMVFDKITATRIRLNFKHTSKQVAICEVECF